jgi:hypothetical protein
MAKIVERHKYNGDQIYQTRRLEFQPYRYCEYNMALVMGLIKRNLTPDLLSPRYRAENQTNPTYGHCYHSTQALFYLMDTDKLQPMSGIDYRGETHWWIQNDDNIYDLTAEQYLSVGKLPPYAVGKKSKWYGWKGRPHQRSLDLMVRVLGNKVTDTVTTAELVGGLDEFF